SVKSQQFMFCVVCKLVRCCNALVLQRPSCGRCQQRQETVPGLSLFLTDRARRTVRTLIKLVPICTRLQDSFTLHVLKFYSRIFIHSCSENIHISASFMQIRPDMSRQTEKAVCFESETWVLSNPGSEKTVNSMLEYYIGVCVAAENTKSPGIRPLRSRPPCRPLV